MTDKRVSMLLVGVGGQGLLTAAQILGDAAHAAGQRVVVGQLHGMSQRGGSVECSVLFGPVRSPYLSLADIVVGFEPLETLRALHRMGPGTRVLMNRGRFVLPNLVRERKPYPPTDRIVADIRAVAKEVIPVDGPGALKKIGEKRALNIFMLGTLVGLGWLPLDDSTLWQAVARRLSPRYLEVNRKAFTAGRSSVLDRAPGPGDLRVPRTGKT